MPNIVVLIKQVPDTWSERKLTDGDFTLDREAADAVLDEINERAVEEALLIKEAQGGEVTVLTAGPDRATEAIRKALSMGADKAVHINDPAIHGSDAVQTAYVLAGAIGQIEGVELIIAGNEATDGRAGAVPAIIAEYLGIPQLTHLRKLTVDGDKVTGERETDEGVFHLEASPASDRQRHREDQRAALPVLQGHHGREEEGSSHLHPGRPRHRPDDRGCRERGHHGHLVHPEAAAHRGREGRRRGRGRQPGRAVPDRPEDHLTPAPTPDFT